MTSQVDDTSSFLRAMLSSIELDMLLTEELLGGRLMAVEIRSITEEIRAAKQALQDLRGMPQELVKAVGEMKAVVGNVTAKVKEIRAATQELQSEMAAFTNGGPPLDDEPNTSEPAMPSGPQSNAFQIAHPPSAVLKQT